MSPASAAKRDRLLALAADGPVLMGIVNITPDSFSDGGRFMVPDAAIAEARRHVNGGASILDVGAESTRPGFTQVAEDEEVARLAPVLGRLMASVDCAVSIDTTKATVAAVALGAGAAFVNDQWGLQGDAAMAETVAAAEAGVVVMHNRPGIDPAIHIVDDMRRFFDRSFQIATAAHIPIERIVLDPGIGFGKSKAQNLLALGRGIDALRQAYGRPVLVGASRKSLFAGLIGATAPKDRLVGTLAAHLTARAYGASLFRVHDCAAHRDAFTVQRAIADG